MHPERFRCYDHARLFNPGAIIHRRQDAVIHKDQQFWLSNWPRVPAVMGTNMLQTAFDRCLYPDWLCHSKNAGLHA